MTDIKEKVSENMKEATDTVVENWERAKVSIKSRWDKLTDEDLHKTEGKTNKILGLMQEKYGYTVEQAKELFDKAKDSF